MLLPRHIIVPRVFPKSRRIWTRTRRPWSWSSMVLWVCGKPWNIPKCMRVEWHGKPWRAQSRWWGNPGVPRISPRNGGDARNMVMMMMYETVVVWHQWFLWRAFPTFFIGNGYGWCTWAIVIFVSFILVGVKPVSCFLLCEVEDRCHGITNWRV